MKGRQVHKQPGGATVPHATGPSHPVALGQLQNPLLAAAFTQLTVSGGATVGSLAVNETPAASVATIGYSVPIVLNGVTYYLLLSKTP